MQVIAIENLHAMWKDACLMHQMLSQIGGDKPRSPANAFAKSQSHIWANAAKLRSFVLDYKQAECLERGATLEAMFLPNAEAPASFPSTILNAPLAIANWRWQSGRLYQVDGDLQEILQQTSIERFVWDDLGLPFPAYAVRCKNPLHDSDGRSYRDIIVSEFYCDGQKLVDIWLVPEKYARISRLKLDSIQSCMRRRDDARLVQRALSIATDVERAGGVLFTLSCDATIKQMVGACPKRSKLLEQTLRIAGGLAVYLQTLPSDTRHLSARSKAEPGHKPVVSSAVRAISDVSQVFDVTSSIELTSRHALVDSMECSHEKSVAEDGDPDTETAQAWQSGRSPSPHWREAHWRRSPGMGQCPTAKKVVYVRRTLILGDKLPRGTLPLGACKTLK
jgi:hypothetical protein